MKIDSVKNNNTNYNSCSNNTANHRNCSVNLNDCPKDSVSFGSLSDKAKTGTSKLFKWIDKKGFFVEFLIVDTISMILPRVLVGLNRDKDKTGVYNYKAGAEEAGREITSGPSMNLIPMGILAAVCANKKATSMDKKSIDAFALNTNKALENTDFAKDTKETINKKLAANLFDSAFANHSFAEDKETGLTAEEVKNDLKSRFVDALSEASTTEKKMFGKNEIFGSRQGAFTNLIEEINNKGLDQPPENTKGLSISTGVTKEAKDVTADLSAGELFEDFHNYSNDIMEKLTKQLTPETTSQKAQSLLNDIKTSRLNTKFATAAAAFFAVGSFLLYLPKLYQRGSVSPAEESAKRAQEAAGGANAN